jgi:hypothetical protein
LTCGILGCCHATVTAASSWGEMAGEGWSVCNIVVPIKQELFDERMLSGASFVQAQAQAQRGQ